MRRLVLIAIILASFVCIAAAAIPQVSEFGTEIGRFAPPIELPDLLGRKVSLESLRGSVVLLNFWSTACPTCRAGLPSLNRLSASMGDKGLQVVSVAIDPSDTTVREYALKNNITFTVLLDPDKATLSDSYREQGLPVTYLIDRNGVIVEKFNGLEVWDAPEMKNRVVQLLERK
jgi:peroxiredoxin